MGKKLRKSNSTPLRFDEKVLLHFEQLHQIWSDVLISSTPRQVEQGRTLSLSKSGLQKHSAERPLQQAVRQLLEQEPDCFVDFNQTPELLRVLIGYRIPGEQEYVYFSAPTSLGEGWQVLALCPGLFPWERGAIRPLGMYHDEISAKHALDRARETLFSISQVDWIEQSPAYFSWLSAFANAPTPAIFLPLPSVPSTSRGFGKQRQA